MNRLVLVIEDDEGDRETYGRLLWYNGFDVIFAIDAEMGWWLAHEAQPDLVLMELGLPDLDGIELCRRIVADEERPPIPVLVLSAKPADEYGDAALEAGCAGYIQKPAPPIEVLHEVERQIGRADAPQEHVAR